ncbi:MAG: hypothetical protein U0U09_05455 [Cyclobacteriaceae bacterium]
MKTSMLEYMKTVLNKVSFDRRLFRKEYKKSHSWLTSTELTELKNWLRKHDQLSVRQSSNL